jgi:hypothetical protein
MRERRYVKQRQAQLIADSFNQQQGGDGGGGAYIGASVPSPAPDLLGTVYASRPRLMRHETLTDDDDDDDEPGGNHEQPYSDTSRQNSGVHSDQRSPAESKLSAFI